MFDIVSILLLVITSMSIPLSILLFNNFSGSKYGNIIVFLIPFTFAETLFSIASFIGITIYTIPASKLILLTAYLSIFFFSIMFFRTFAVIGSGKRRRRK